MKLKIEGSIKDSSGVFNDIDTDEMENVITEAIMDEFGIDDGDITITVKVER